MPSETLPPTATVGFDKVKSRVEKVLRLDLASDEAREAHDDFVVEVLQQLFAEIESIKQQANGYPAKPISALVWMNGAGYANLSQALTRHFRAAGWLKCEEYASALWAKATLAVCAHYHHMVGPAMLANADCLDRLGNSERSSDLYASIVLDFSFIADNWSQEEESPGDEDRLALESLQTATERLLARGAREIEGIDLASLEAQISRILLRPTIPDDASGPSSEN